ncbi:MAG: hypothetical protein AAFO94_07655 [Bacteroidota bacterium]
MKPIDNPMFGKIGAFWVEGCNDAFYGIQDALEHQRQHGGNVLDPNGKMLYMDIQHDQSESLKEKLDTIPKPDFSETRMAQPKGGANWLMSLFSRA